MNTAKNRIKHWTKERDDFEKRATLLALEHSTLLNRQQELLSELTIIHSAMNMRSSWIRTEELATKEAKNSLPKEKLAAQVRKAVKKATKKSPKKKITKK